MAWRRARRGKKPSVNQLSFDLRWLDRLAELTTALRTGAWQPAPTVAFVVCHPKTREIHAPDFSDRVVHHLLVARLEKWFEPHFIHDSYANRTGKGSHAAVARLQDFLRRRENMPDQKPSGGWFLQLDIQNFFNTIHRPTLYRLLCQRLNQAMQRDELPEAHGWAMRGLCHALLAHKVIQHERDPQAAARLPRHKRLCHAPPGRGLPVGNLTSQFFANVYLNPLDQFIKHTLKVRHYVRYVDDLVLLGASAQQLQHWHARITTFLRHELGLALRPQAVLQPACQGVDFLGYRVFAHHRWVRPRVVRHCRQRLAAWRRRHPDFERVKARNFVTLQALLGSYWGHFSHAHSVRLRQRLWADFPWLAEGFDLLPDGRLRVSAPGKWVVKRHREWRQQLFGG